jgi:tetratricopeptide (TPR) repeat protein
MLRFLGLLGIPVFAFGIALGVQLGGTPARLPDATWTGKRVVMLNSFGDYFSPGENAEPRLIKASGLSVNVVSVVDHVEGGRVWIKGNGAGDLAVGWLDKDNVILLEDAVSYFSSLIDRNPNNWDAYFRRAESEHSLNQRDAAISDYSSAIRLHADEPFLYLRRGRSFRIVKAWGRALEDFDEAIRLRPQWAELYNMEAGIYSDCPDPRYRDPQKAISLIEHAIALDIQHPTYLTVLAYAYAQAGQLEKAITIQKQALESPLFPPGYRQEATLQLRKYEDALAARKDDKH